MTAKVIRKIEYPDKPWYFSYYELECIDCGAIYRSGHADKRMIPYCPDCNKKYEKEKQRARNAERKKALINDVLYQIKEDVQQRLDDPYHYIVKSDACTEVLDIIDYFIQ